jgi:hypothetical protein
MQPDQMSMLAQAKQLFAPAQPAVDGLTQFREIFGFALDLVDARGGGGGGGRRSGWDVGLDIVKEGGQQVLQPVLNFVQNMMFLKNQGAGATPPVPSAAPTTPAAFDAYRTPQATRAYANTLNSQQSQQQQPPAGQQPASPPPPAPAPPPPPRRRESGTIRAVHAIRRPYRERSKQFHSWFRGRRLCERPSGHSHACRDRPTRGSCHLENDVCFP